MISLYKTTTCPKLSHKNAADATVTISKLIWLEVIDREEQLIPKETLSEEYVAAFFFFLKTEL